MLKQNEPVKRLYTLKEADRYLGRPDWGMRELMWSGKIPFVRTEGGRKIYFDVSDLDEYINKNKRVFR
jgi:excisionase family DNA binding protein